MMGARWVDETMREGEVASGKKKRETISSSSIYRLCVRTLFPWAVRKSTGERRMEGSRPG